MQDRQQIQERKDSIKGFLIKYFYVNFRTIFFLDYAFCSFLYQDIIVKIRLFEQKSHCEVRDISL